MHLREKLAFGERWVFVFWKPKKKKENLLLVVVFSTFQLSKGKAPSAATGKNGTVGLRIFTIGLLDYDMDR
jgi:hypothetical protein